jgi:hypothetical protein
LVSRIVTCYLLVVTCHCEGRNPEAIHSVLFILNNHTTPDCAKIIPIDPRPMVPAP